MNSGLQLSRQFISRQIRPSGVSPIFNRKNGSSAFLNNSLSGPGMLARLQARRGLQSGFQAFAGKTTPAKGQAPKMKDILRNRHHAAVYSSHPDLYQRDADGSLQVRPEKWEKIKSLITARVGDEFQQQISSTGIVKWSPRSKMPAFRADSYEGMNPPNEVLFRVGKTVYGIKPDSELPRVISGPGKPEDALLGTQPSQQAKPN